MNKIKVSAPGKLMIVGEHAVVYGKPCIVTAVDQRMYVAVEINQSGFLDLEAPDVNISDYKKKISEIGRGEIPKEVKFVETAVANFINSKKIKLKGLKIRTRSEFSSKFGFGSSSASTVCIIKALSELYDLNLSEKNIFDLSYNTVLDVQGKGSGFDVAAAVYGGTLYFITGGKVIEPLKIESTPLIVGYSGIKADTVVLIDKVLEKADKHPEIIDGIYSLIEKLVIDARLAILKGDFITLGELMNINQGFLESLGVSIDKLNRMNYAAIDAGAFGSKLSGAGGGDCIIALADNKSKIKVEQAIKKAGGEVLKVTTNAQGVRIEE